MARAQRVICPMMQEVLSTHFMYMMRIVNDAEGTKHTLNGLMRIVNDAEGFKHALTVHDADYK